MAQRRSLHVSSRPDLKIGENCFIFEDNTIQPFVTIGDNRVLWSGNHVGHNPTVGDHVFVTSQVVISGACTIGDNSFLGVNATIRMRRSSRRNPVWAWVL